MNWAAHDLDQEQAIYRVWVDRRVVRDRGTFKKINTNKAL